MWSLFDSIWVLVGLDAICLTIVAYGCFQCNEASVQSGEICAPPADASSKWARGMLAEASSFGVAEDEGSFERLHLI